MIYLLAYISMALSFSILTLYTVHIKGMREVGVENKFAVSAIYVILSFVFFPTLLLPWIMQGTEYKKLYSKRLKEMFEELDK